MRLIVLALCALGGEADAMGEEPAMIDVYQNPVQVQLGDPWVLFDEGVYYLYGTHDRDAQAGFPVYTSRDLVHWEWGGFALKKTADTWSQCNFWGPEVHRRGDAYYMYYCASPGPEPGPPFNMHLCIAVSDAPTGPFREIAAPWFQPEGGDEAIDQSLLLDDDGTAHLYWTRVTMGFNQIEAMPLGPDLRTFAGDTTLCIRPTQEWERHATHNHLVAEGAFVFKRKGVYYLTYTGNSFTDPNYAIGYATSAGPTGPWTKATHNPILARTNRVSGPGNGMIVPSPDGSEQFIVYHTHGSPRSVWPRQVAIDRVRFVAAEDGPDRIVVDGPTHTPQPLPAGAPARACGGSDDFAAARLDRACWRVVNEDPAAWRLDDGVIITAQNGDMWEQRADFRNLFLQHLPPDASRVIVRVAFDPRANFEQVFLTIWQDHENYVRLAHVWDDGPRLAAAVERDGKVAQTVIDNTLGTDLLLRIDIDREADRYACHASADGTSWIAVGPAVSAKLSTPQAGFGAIAPVSGHARVAAFRAWRIE